MKESVAVAKEADAKKGFSPTKSSDSSIQRLRNEPERQLGSLRGVIGNIRRDGGTPSVDSIATELSSMHSAQRAPALLALQQTHGNRYVQRVVAGIQAKLVVGQPGDIYEQEAERVADAVMRMTEPEVQRQFELEEEEEEEEQIQTKLLAKQITPVVQRQEGKEEREEKEILQTKELSGKAPEVTPDLESSIQSLKGGGQLLPESVRAFFEPRFSYDFSQVRIHADSEAAETAQALKARAFTVGQDIVFGAGEYAPKSTTGKRLLAHELTHVVQQGANNRLEKHQDLLAPQMGKKANSNSKRICQAGLVPAASVAPRIQLYCETGVSRTSQECCPNLDNVIFDLARELWVPLLVDIYPEASFVDSRIWSRPSQRGFLDEDIHFRNPGGPLQHFKIVVSISWNSEGEGEGEGYDPLHGLLGPPSAVALIVGRLRDFSFTEGPVIGVWTAYLERTDGDCRVTNTSDNFLELVETIRRRQRRRRPRQRTPEGGTLNA